MNSGIEVVAAPLRKKVIERLHESLANLEYQPGERLIERELCERFGVSRTVVREALRHLEAEGLVSLVPNRGPVVASTSPDEARALYEVRGALEGLAAQLCAERSTPAQKKQLSRALARVADAYRKDDQALRLDSKAAFYEVLCTGAHNPTIALLLRSVHARIQMLRSLSLLMPGRAEESLKELTALVAAIERGDPESARELATHHVTRAEEAALAHLAEEASAVGEGAAREDAEAS